MENCIRVATVPEIKSGPPHPGRVIVKPDRYSSAQWAAVLITLLGYIGGPLWFFGALIFATEEYVLNWLPIMALVWAGGFIASFLFGHWLDL